jgi:hypothetical protein
MMKMKKKVLTLLTLLVLVGVLFSGCGFVPGMAGAPGKGNDSSPAQDIQNQDDDVQQTMGNQTYITDATSFRNGYAWAEFSEYDTAGYFVSSKWCCIDTQGNVAFELPAGIDESDDFELTDFADGVALVNNEALINTQGQAVWSVDGDGWVLAEELFGEGNTQDIGIMDGGYFMGVAFVWFSIDTFEETATYYGILGSDGNWIQEPTKDLKMPEYIGEGLYHLKTPDETGYYNDYAFFSPKSKKVTKDRDEAYSWSDEYIEENYSGLVYNKNSGGFCNTAGDLVIDLSEYDLRDDPEFHNGYCVLNIENKQSSSYFTVIDPSGNRMFEPKKEVTHEEFVSDGLLRVKDDDEIYFLDMQGEVAVGPLEYENAESYSDGLCLVSSQNLAINRTTYAYLDQSGNRVI